MANVTKSPISVAEMEECNCAQGRTMPWAKGDTLFFQGTHSIEQTNNNKWLAVQVTVNGIVKNLSAAQLVRVGNGIYEGGDATNFVNVCNQLNHALVVKEVRKVLNSYGNFSNYLFFERPVWLQQSVQQQSVQPFVQQQFTQSFV